MGRVSGFYTIVKELGIVEPISQDPAVRLSIVAGRVLRLGAASTEVRLTPCRQWKPLQQVVSSARKAKFTHPQGTEGIRKNDAEVDALLSSWTCLRTGPPLAVRATIHPPETIEVYVGGRT